MKPLVKAGKLREDTYVFGPNDRYPAWGIADTDPEYCVVAEDRDDSYYSWQAQLKAKVSVYVDFIGTDEETAVVVKGWVATRLQFRHLSFSETWLRTHLREWAAALLNSHGTAHR